MTRSFLAALLVALSPAQPSAGNPSPIAQVLCAPAAKMQDRLEIQLGSLRSWQGLRGPDEIMELWEDERGDWALVISYANGNTCIVATGSSLGGFAGQFQG